MMKPLVTFGKNLSSKKILLFISLGVLLGCGGCFRYGFTGASIPEGVNTIYIPFFPNNSTSSVPNISSKLHKVLIDRFVHRSSLSLSNNKSRADAILIGSINSYSDQPFSISGENRSVQNKVRITVKAKFKYSNKDKPEWNKVFSGSATYDPTQNPIQGENNAAIDALNQLANNMFNEAVSNW